MPWSRAVFSLSTPFVGTPSATGPTLSLITRCDICVGFVIRMARWAVCSFGTLRRHRVAAKQVDSARHWLQVIGIHAQAACTTSLLDVIEVQPLRDRTNTELICPSVGQGLVPNGNTKKAIAFAIGTRYPQPTGVSELDLCEESLRDRGSSTLYGHRDSSPGARQPDVSSVTAARIVPEAAAL